MPKITNQKEKEFIVYVLNNGIEQILSLSEKEYDEDIYDQQAVDAARKLIKQLGYTPR